MKSRLSALPLAALACLFTAGCASHPAYYVAAPPPPPPGYAVPPMVAQAQREGFRMGSSDGARDAYNGVGHHPKHARAFHDTPGYDPAMGPYNVYRDTFRQSFIQGYDQAYYRR